MSNLGCASCKIGTTVAIDFLSNPFVHYLILEGSKVFCESFISSVTNFKSRACNGIIT